MDPEPPVKRNLFLIAIVIFFNLIWLTLLFMSCQADENSQPDLTPMVKVESRQVRNPNEPLSLIDLKESNLQLHILCAPNMGTAFSTPIIYKVPLYRPPST